MPVLKIRNGNKGAHGVDIPTKLIKVMRGISRSLPVYERVYCWFLILIGVAGGLCATVNAVNNILSSNFSEPCYIASYNASNLVGSH